MSRLQKKKPFVSIRSDSFDEEEPDEDDDDDIKPSTTTTAFILDNTYNNNSSRDPDKFKNQAPISCFLPVKEELVDPDDTGYPPSCYPAPSAVGVLSTATKIVEVSTEETITIKTEPRAFEEDEEEGADQNAIEEEDSMDEECAFEDDDNDEDFELDSSEAMDTPDSVDTAGRKSINSKDNSVSPESVISDSIKKEEDPSENESGEMENSTFDFNGMTIETKGNYSKCPKCLKNIKSTFIIRHIKLHDTPLEKFPCPEKNCNLKVNRINNLFRHLRETHRSKKPYMCKKRDCLQRFAKSQQLREHSNIHRAERKKEAESSESNKTYPCEFPGCGKEYKKRHHLKEHERKHTGDMKYSCEVCGKRFYIQAHMKRHLYSHTGIKPHVCRWKCGAIFASYGGRMKHERINHYEENPLKSECGICGRPFKNQQQLVKHQMTHLNPEERKDYRCSYCHIMFDTIKIRERHEERHKDGEVFECESCRKTFKNEKNLSHHVKTHHMKKEMAEDEEKGRGGHHINKKPKKEPPPKHHCHICGPPKLFCLTSLRRHLARIHSTNFKCPREECGKFFKEKFQLDAHVEIHRLRECHICGKKFQRKQNADIHLLGVHNLSKDDLAKLGRWNPKKDADKCPDYMTRKTNSSFKKFREKQRKQNKKKGGREVESESEEVEEPLCEEQLCGEIKEEPTEIQSGEILYSDQNVQIAIHQMS